MKIVESFVSFQGEGKFIGRLAIFFRFGGCNLDCKGFDCHLKSPKTGEILVGCDTIRAVKISHFDYEEADFNKLLKIIDDLKFFPIVVITGGEPLIYHKNDDFYDFISEILKRNLQVHFETNGTQFIDFKNFTNYKKCYFAISPKLSISGEKKEKRLNYKALENMKKNAKDSFYKFVINPQNLDNEKKEIEEILKIAPNDVYLMPLGKNKKELEQNSQKVAEFAINCGFNYSDRIHIRIYDDKEKV